MGGGGQFFICRYYVILLKAFEAVFVHSFPQ